MVTFKNLFLTLLLITLVLLANIPVYGQIKIPSPDVANKSSLLKTGTSLYTGRNNINIPIYTIDLGNLEVPISLSYNTGGIKVAEIASSCGLGWNLNTGASLSRQVRGLSDETPDSGYYARRNIIVPIYDKDKKIEWEPDMFYYSTPSSSGKFMLDSTGSLQSVPLKDVSASFFTENFNNNTNLPYPTNSICISSFNISDEERNSYQFSHPEKSISWSNVYSSNGPFSTSVNSTAASYYANSWGISRIISAQNDSLEYEYDMETLWYEVPYNTIFRKMLSGDAPQVLGDGETYIPEIKNFTRRIKKIRFPHGCIDFVYDSVGRKDLLGSTALRKIIIKNSKNEKLKQFTLDYGYMYGNAILNYDSTLADGESNFTNKNCGITGNPRSCNTNNLSKRLVLLAVSENDKNGLPINNTITFDYNRGLPSRLSKSTDYWGYYNGIQVKTTAVINDTLQFTNNCMDPNMNAFCGALSKIDFGNGLIKEFAYSNNMGKYVESPSPQEEVMGGIRIQGESTQYKQGTSINSPNIYWVFKNYLYSNGWAARKPFHSRKYTFSVIRDNMPNLTQQYSELSLNSYYPFTTTGGAEVGYGQVTVQNETEGEVEYYYTTA